MIKVICFDLFSTLVDVGSVPLSIGRMTADILGMQRDEWNQLCFSEHHEICQPTNASDVIRTLAHQYDPSISPDTIEQAVYERQCRFDYALKQHIEEDVLAGIIALKQRGYTLILVSNASTAEVQAWNDSPLAEHFDHSVFSCTVGVKKPDRAMYFHAYKLANVEPKQCLFVGDGGSNELMGARQAGMKVLLMTRFLKNKAGERFHRFSEYLDGTVYSTAEVLAWLDANSA